MGGVGAVAGPRRRVANRPDFPTSTASGKTNRWRQKAIIRFRIPLMPSLPKHHRVRVPIASGGGFDKLGLSGFYSRIWRKSKLPRTRLSVTFV